MPVFVKFWGTRGSIPTPSSWTRVYGGNTSCVEIRVNDTIFICDAGSGIRELGKDLMTRVPRPKELHLFITHTHWDHIQGFPFFAPAYAKDNRIHVYGGKTGEGSPHELLSGQMTSAYFPVSFKELGAQVISEGLNNGPREIAGTIVRSLPLNHPGGCFGYSFEHNGCKVVYATDAEVESQPGDLFPDPQCSGPLRQVPKQLEDWAKGADLLIFDAQYDDLQYLAKKGWGHSSCFTATDLAIRAGVKRLALFHHDPESSDGEVDAKVADCKERVARRGSELIVFGAREGVELKL